MSIASLPQRTTGQRQWMAASMKQNLEHVSKDGGTLRRFKDRGWEGGIEVM